MPVQRTLAIIKPDVVRKHKIGAVVDRIEAEGFRILGLKPLHLTSEQAEGFYAVHRGRPFFQGLTKFMSSGSIIVMCLEREDAIQKWREVIGATDPAKAALGTVRQSYGSTVGENAVHGSDGPDTAAFEISYFFGACELSPLD
jgi:nucleoside-diphosphate kinase